MSQRPQYADPNYYLPPNPLATWALVLGILALIFSPVIIGGILGLVAILLGVLAARRPSSKGMAITGIVLAAFAIVVASFAGWITYNIYHFASTRIVTPHKQAAADVATLKTALEGFEIDFGRFPTTAEGLAALRNPPPDAAGKPTNPYLAVIPDDPWGHPYLYISPGKLDAYELRSAGPDGIPNTKDDIVVKP